MMVATHAPAGVVLGTVAQALIPRARMFPVLTAVLDGLLPGFDLYADHQKTLHLPVYFSALTVSMVAVTALNPTTTTLAVALFLAVAAFHSTSDVFDGNLELKPWLGTSECVVYDHQNGQWLTPKRLIRYDDAPEDLALTLVFAVPSVLVLGGLAETFVIGTIVVSGVYVLFHKPMVVIAEIVVAAMPGHVIDLMPERFVYDFR